MYMLVLMQDPAGMLLSPKHAMNLPSRQGKGHLINESIDSLPVETRT
jgi:hypothetical protein